MDNQIERFKNLLGAEAAGQWVLFMDEVERTLSFLSKGGAPRKEDIQSSIIGASGCATWKEFLETKLGWSYNSWKAWRKAYLVVNAHPYLRELGLSASEINTINRENSVFPADIHAFKALKTSRQAAIDAQYDDSVSQLKAALASANAEIERLKLIEPEIIEVEKPVTIEKIVPKTVYRDSEKHKKMLYASLAVNAVLAVILLIMVV